MGWNTITQLRGPLFEGINEGAYMYFVHSYYVEVTSYTTAVANYGVEVSTALQKDNFYAIQPHPEKSADAGMKFLENFINL